MSWPVKFFESTNERKPVESFLEKLNDVTAAKVFRTLNLLETYGPDLGMPHSRKMASQLYELRIRGQVELRIFYAFHRQTIILLNAFQKKSQKTPSRELKTAQERLEQLDTVS